MATVTLSGVAGSQPKRNHEGVNVVVCDVSLSVTSSPGDIFVIGKLPAFAIPVEAVLYPGPAISGAVTCAFGLSGTANAIFPSATYSAATYRMGIANIAPTVAALSLSDEAMPRYQNIIASSLLSVTVGFMWRLCVFYTMPPGR